MASLIKFRRREFAVSYISYSIQYSMGQGFYKIELPDLLGDVNISEIPARSRAFKINLDGELSTTQGKVRSDRT